MGRLYFYGDLLGRKRAAKKRRNVTNRDLPYILKQKKGNPQKLVPFFLGFIEVVSFFIPFSKNHVSPFSTWELASSF